MHDLLPGESARWQHAEAVVRDAMLGYGYAELRTPLIESTALFTRGIGEATDIVEKEMYTFESRSGDSLTLRPENTAGCVRSALQHGLMSDGVANRIWYNGPMFRYERPQKGRTRQFHQVGAEVYGVAGAGIEAELILLSARIWAELGIQEVLSLEVNTLGTSEERAAYRENLVTYFRSHTELLDEDSTRRLETNPLRILDSKNPKMQSMIEAAPQLKDTLGEQSLAHFAELKEILASCNVEAIENPRLVRGLDYYSHTVWEWTTDRLGAQGAVCGGGRYDGLVTELGGKPCPAVGWALGMERLLALMEEVAVTTDSKAPHGYVISSPDVPAQAAHQLSEQLRDEMGGLRLVCNAVPSSIKAQFKRADKSGALFALILGTDEHAAGTVTVKPLRSDGGERGNEQQTLDRQQLLAFLTERID